ncbi:hypothetical protein HJG43_08725 [Kineosporiaceae bacterium SCSIO 59966]|nr:hypothetical protein HJG43_08725 [Kineosporiaceae bacterium SCSIO 59966]
MAKEYGVEYPERPLMSVISDLLGIPHFTTSRGSTVRSDFLRAVAETLGIPAARSEALRKDELLAAVVEAATREPMDPTLYSPGGTVTDRALQRIIDGLILHGTPGRLPAIVPPEDEPVIPELDDFDPGGLQDERDRRLVETAVREGQDRFRSALMAAYGSACAITEYTAVETLQAAHIFPYRGPATNSVSNGLLLRADVHLLFDRGAIAVHEASMEVLIKPHLEVTQYVSLAGKKLRRPQRLRDRPSTAALRSHREWAGL